MHTRPTLDRPDTPSHPRYDSYKDSGVEWMGEIPQHWYSAKLKYVTSCLDSQRIPLNSEERGRMQGDIPYWGANGIVDHVDDWLFDEELVLLGEDGAPFFDRHKPVAFLVDGKVWVNNHIHILRANDRIIPSFLTHALNTVDFSGFIGGSTRDKLTQGNMGDIWVQLPPRPEQRAIAAYLDRETERIDTLVAKKERLIELLEEKRTALISHAVTKGLDDDAEMKDSGVEWLGKIPAGWEAIRLRFVLDTSPSKSEVKDLDPETDVSFVPMESVGKGGGLDLTQTKPIGDVINGYTYFRDGDVVVAKITPCFENGKGAFAKGLKDGIGFGTTELHVLRPNEGLQARFLFYATMSHPFRKIGESTMYGAGGQKRISDDFIQNLQWPIPPLSEQRAIAAYLDRETERIDALEDKIRDGIDRLKEYRTALISTAVTGQIDVRGEI